MPFIQLDEVKIHYQQQGNGSNPIVFIHGNFGSWRHWLPSLENAPDNYICYAPDLRGCGDSSVPDSGYNIETLSNDILGFVNALKLDKFHIVGHSLGGAVALELANTMPKRIQTLTLVAPAPAEGLKSLEKVLTSDSKLSATNVFQFFDNIGLRNLIQRISFKKTMPKLRKNMLYLDMIVEDARKMDIKAFDGFLKSLKTWRGTAYLETLSMPVLITHGDLDSVIPLQSLKNMHQQIKNCQFHTFRNIGHSPPLENPTDFNEILFGFLAGQQLSIEDNGSQTPHKTGFIRSLITKLKNIFKKMN